MSGGEETVPAPYTVECDRRDFENKELWKQRLSSVLAIFSG